MRAQVVRQHNSQLGQLNSQLASRDNKATQPRAGKPVFGIVLAFLMLAIGAGANSAYAAPPLKKVGEAQLKVMFWSIYDSRLYTSSGSYSEGERPLRLEIDYRRDVSVKALVDNTRKEWNAMGRAHPRRDQWLAALTELWPDIKENDVLRLELDAEGVSTFTHNGETLGRIEDPEFGQQFVDIWLSEDCTRPALRTALLGKAG